MEPYKHDFSGHCAQGEKGCWVNRGGQNTFSLGIFQWIPKSTGKGLKKSAVKVRVHGYISDSKVVYQKAREIIKELDDETYSGKKNITVKGDNNKL